MRKDGAEREVAQINRGDQSVTDLKEEKKPKNPLKKKKERDKKSLAGTEREKEECRCRAKGTVNRRPDIERGDNSKRPNAEWGKISGGM